jgi:hypothetical protein
MSHSQVSRDSPFAREKRDECGAMEWTTEAEEVTDS